MSPAVQDVESLVIQVVDQSFNKPYFVRPVDQGIPRQLIVPFCSITFRRENDVLPPGQQADLAREWCSSESSGV